MKFTEDFINPLDPLLKLMGPPDPVLDNNPMLTHLAQKQRKRRQEMSKQKGLRKIKTSAPTKLDAVKKIEAQKAKVLAVRNASTAETRRLKAVNPNEYNDSYWSKNKLCAFCSGKLPDDDSKEITACEKCGIGMHAACKASLGACPKCLMTNKETVQRMPIEDAMNLRDKSMEPPRLPSLCPPPPPLPAAVKPGETKKPPELMKALPGPGVSSGPADGKKSDLENTPIEGTKIPKLPTAVKAGSLTPSSTSSSSTATGSTATSTTTVVTPKPTYPTYEQAKKIIAGMGLNPSASTSTKAALVQEWKGKIARLTKDGGCDEIKWEHIVASAIAFIPRHKKVSRIRTLMKLLKIKDAMTVKMIYEDSGMSDIPFIPHPGVEIAESSSELRGEINKLNKNLNDMKEVRADLMKEVNELDFEAQTAKEACVGIATEILRVLNFFDEQFNTIFAEEADAHQGQFNFMRRVLTTEISTFELVKRRTEMEIIQGPPIQDS